MSEAVARDLAFPSVGSLAAGAFDSAMKSVWDFAGGFLTTAFEFIDKFTTPNLDPTTGPITTVLPTVGWIAGAVASLLVFVQIGHGAITRGVGLAKLLVGAGQYVFVTACGYGLLVVGVTAATGLTHGILSSGLNVDDWAGINGTNNGPLLAAAQAQTGVQLGIVAIFCVIPAAAGYLVEAMVRAAALLILAATLPILAAGLLSEKTASWFWKGLRWTIALLMLQPVTALVVTIGFNIAAGSAGGAPGTGGVGDGLGSLLIGGITLLVSLVCPFALFKLLAFVDPATPSGSAVRSSMAGGGGQASRAAGGGQKAEAGQAAGEAATSGRFAAALGKAGPYGAAAVGALKVAHTVGQRTVGAADHVLSAAGAGHHGGGTSATPVSSGAARPGAGSAPRGTSASAAVPAQPAGADADAAVPAATGRVAGPPPRSAPGGGRRARPVPPPPLREPNTTSGTRRDVPPPPVPDFDELLNAEKESP